MELLSLRLFLRVAELGSVSAAARDISLSPASASARLMKLEETLGFRLFNRTTRAVSLTTDGADFLPYAQQALETLDQGQASVSGKGENVRGLLRITMPGSFGRMYVVPLLGEFRQRYPEVNLDLRLSDELLDAVEGAYDLIIRNAPLVDSGMVARRLASDRRILAASPKYLEKHGSPETIQDLKTHQFVVLTGGYRWKFHNGETVQFTRTCEVNDGEAMRLLIEGGLGIGVKSVWNAHQSLKDGLLVQVLPHEPLITESSIWALYPSGRILAPKVRAMIDFLVEKFTPTPPWEL